LTFINKNIEALSAYYLRGCNFWMRYWPSTTADDVV